MLKNLTLLFTYHCYSLSTGVVMTTVEVPSVIEASVADPSYGSSGKLVAFPETKANRYINEIHTTVFMISLMLAPFSAQSKSNYPAWHMLSGSAGREYTQQLESLSNALWKPNVPTRKGIHLFRCSRAC